MVVSIAGGSSPLTIACSGSGGGLGTCTSTTSQCRSLAGNPGTAGWTGGTRSGSAYIQAGGSGQRVSSTQQITFHQTLAPPAASPGVEGIYVDSPRGVLIPGTDQYVVRVYADAGRYTLFQWGITMLYSTPHLTYQSLVAPDTNTFSPPFVSVSGGRVSANTAAKAGASEAARQGSSIHVATITFNVAASMGIAANPSALANITCLFLVNVNNNQFVTNSLATVYDSMGVNSIGRSSLEVSPSPVVIGLRAVSSTPYVATLPDGRGQGTSITTTRITTVFNTADQPAGASAVCTTTDVGALSIPSSSCSSILPASASIATPAQAAVVRVTDGANPGVAAALVQVRAFVPQSIRLVLHSKAGSSSASTLAPGEMRRTKVLVRWSSGLGLSEEVDVSRTPHTVQVVSSNPSAIEVLRDGFVRATSAAANNSQSSLTLNTTIGAYSGVAAVVASVAAPAQQHQAVIAYYRTVSWSASRIPTVLPTPKLSQEGDSHRLVAVSTVSGTLIRASSITSSHPGTYLITYPSLLGLASSREDGYVWSASVPVNAPLVACSSLNVSGSAMEVGSWSLPSRNVDVPIVGVSTLEFCCSNAVELSPAGDSLLFAGYSVASYSGLTVTARMSDGSSRVVTGDARLSVQVVQNTCGAIVSSTTGAVSSVSSAGTLSLLATFRGVTSNVVQLRSVVTVGVQPHAVLHGDASQTPVSTIKVVNCAGNVYQSIRGRARLVTSVPGLLVPISNQYIYFYSDALRLSSSPDGFSGVAPGTARLFAESRVQSSVPAGNTTITVVSSSALLQTVVVSPFPQDTLLGPYNWEEFVVVAITMEGGVSIGNIFGGGWPDYTPGQLLPSLITMSSNAPEEIGIVMERGKAVLLANSAQPVTISVSATHTTCDGRSVASPQTSLQKTIPVAGNIELRYDGDVDIGRATGVAVPPITGQLSDAVDLRVRSSVAALKAFDLVVLFDTQRVTMQSCAAGSGWGGSFGCTINNAEGYAQVIGADVSSTAQSASIRVASMVFARVSSGAVRLSGVRIKISTSGYPNFPCDVDPVPASSTQAQSAVPDNTTLLCPFVSGGDVPAIVGSPTRAIKVAIQRDEWADTDRRGDSGGGGDGPVLPSFLVHRIVESMRSGGGGHATGRSLLQSLNVGVVSTANSISNSILPGGGGRYGDANNDGTFDITDYLFAQEFYNGATQLGCPSSGGVGCQQRSSLSAWQDAQLHPVADPNAPTGGRDLFYLFNTYSDKLRFAVDIDFRSSPDFLNLGVRLVDRSGAPASATNTRVLFAIKTTQRDILGGSYDDATGLLLAYSGVPRAGGWFTLSTHEVEPSRPSYPSSFDGDGQVTNRFFEPEVSVGVAFSVETADAQGVWDQDPLRRSPFFGIHAGSYASGFDSFSPFAIVNLTATDLCTYFFPWMLPAPSNSSDTPSWPAPATRVETLDPSLDGAIQAVLSVVVVGVDHSSIDRSNPVSTHQTWAMHPVACFLGVSSTRMSLHSVEVVSMGQDEVAALGGDPYSGYNSTERQAIESQGGVALVTVLVLCDNEAEAAGVVARGIVGATPPNMSSPLLSPLSSPLMSPLSRGLTVGLSNHPSGASLLAGVRGASMGVLDTDVWVRFYQPPPFGGGGRVLPTHTVWAVPLIACVVIVLLGSRR